MKNQKGTSAAEIIAELNSDPAFTARQRKKEEAMQRKAAEWRKAEAPLVAELKQAGEVVESGWDLVNTTRSYPKAVPVLLKHLQLSYPDRVREGIARALAVSEAKVGWRTLVRLFVEDKDETGLGAKQAIGRALGAAADDDVLDDIILLLRDKRHGANRIALLDALVRSSSTRACSLLIELQDDPELSHEARKALKCILAKNRKRR